MEYTNLLITIFISFLTSGITAWISYSFAVKKMKTEMQLNHKQEKYEKLLITMRRALYQNSTNEEMQPFLDTKVSTFLYASDAVIQCIDEVYEVYNNKGGIGHDDALLKNKNLINAIKKDLGGNESKLDKKFFPFDYTPHNQ